MPTAERPALRFFNAYLATIVSTGAVLLTLFVVPQTGAILAKAGLSEYAYDPAGTVIRTASFAFMAFAYTVLFTLVVPHDREDGAGPDGSLLARVQDGAVARTEHLSVAVLALLDRFSSRGRKALGVLLMALGAVLAWVFESAALAPRHGEADLASTWPAIVVAGFGAWVALVPESCVKNRKEFTWGWRVPPRILLVIGGLAVIGQILWALPIWTQGAWSTQAYTIWGVGFLVFLAAVIGRLLDAAARRTPWPVRPLAGLGVLALLGGDAAEVLRATGSPAGAGDTTPYAWYDAMTARGTR